MAKLVYATLQVISVSELWPINNPTPKLVEEYSKLLDQLPPGMAWAYSRNARMDDGTKYELVDGCNRRAARIAMGVLVMPCYVLSYADRKRIERWHKPADILAYDKYVIITTPGYCGPYLTYRESGLRTEDPFRYDEDYSDYGEDVS